ncbi:MAG: LysR family transcriptional regulator [Alphaproteobacteria bacterium]|nr:LysR family transcriptional regulator [Alphaproteobacteria bacterium]
MKSNLDWNRFKLFYYVVQAGGITAASKKLHLSQPALSRSIQILENQINTQLFERHARGLILTRQGKQLFQSVSKVFDEFAYAEMLIQEQSDELQGTLKISTTTAIAAIWMVDHLSDFITHNPKMRLVVIGCDEELELKNYKGDVYIRPYMQGYPHLVQEYLFSVHLRLYASKGYLEKFGSPDKLEDLNHHLLIAFSNERIHFLEDGNWSLRVGQLKDTSPEPFFCINSPQGMHRAAELGHGIVALAREITDISPFIEVLPNIKKPEITIYFSYPVHLSSSKRVRYFCNYLKARIGKRKVH